MRFRAITDTATDAFVTGNIDGRIIGWNPGAERIFGYTKGEALGHKLTILIPPTLKDRHLSGMKRAQTSGERHIVELFGKRKDGSEFPLEISLAEWTDGKKQFFTGIIRDITERKEVEAIILAKSEELAASNSELEQFAYIASHDLREPLRMVNSFLALLERRNPHLDAESKEFIGFARDGALRMDRMVLALLELSRIGRSSIPLHRVKSEIVVTEAITNLKTLIKETGSTIIIVDPLPEVLAIQEELLMLFQNLIGNAIKYRRPNVPLMIGIANNRQDNKWHFSISDNGIGINSEYYESIFGIFQRLHTREQYEGVGIGLALCKKIVESHGGSIWVESMPGGGSTFHFTLINEKEQT
jgi:PAS domain S-box-containing protein